MKRSPEMTDDEWQDTLDARKKLAEERMKASDSFHGLAAIRHASLQWYGNASADNMCRAENRLHRGETP